MIVFLPKAGRAKALTTPEQCDRRIKHIDEQIRIIDEGLMLFLILSLSMAALLAVALVFLC